MLVTMNPDVNFVKIEKMNVIPLKTDVIKLYNRKDKQNVLVMFNENRANIKWILLKYMLAPRHDVIEIKYNENDEDVKRKLNSSDIFVFDQITSDQMKFISSFFNEFTLSQTELNACFIKKNNNRLNCIN